MTDHDYNRLFPLSAKHSIEDARAAGYQCGMHGPDEKNCHFSLFATPEMTAAWEEGKRKGEQRARKVRHG